MTEAEILAKVKSGIGISGTFHDEPLKIYIEESKQYLIDAGVTETIVNNSVSVGVIIRGVSDLWNYGTGSGLLSEYFKERAIQLKYKEVASDG